MNINLSISPAVSITNKIAITVAESAVPSVIVDSQEFNPPHSSNRNVTFTGLNPVSHIVNTYETTGLPTLGQLLHSFQYDPTFQQAIIKPTELLRLPLGGTQYTDVSWKGFQIDTIERVGSGTQYVGENINYLFDVDGDVIGFELAIAGDQFGDNEKFVVRFLPQIVTVNPIVQTQKIIAGEDILTSDVTLTQTESGKLLIASGLTEHFTITLPDIISVPSDTPYYIISEGGVHLNVTIKASGTNSIFFEGDALPEIHLSQNEQVWLKRTPSGWRIMQCSDGIFLAGQVIAHYENNLKGYILADGSVQDRLVLRKLWQRVQGFDVNSICSDADWNSLTVNNKGKYSTGNNIDTFRLPQLYNAEYIAGVDGVTKFAGQFTAGTIGNHKHGLPIGSINKFGNKANTGIRGNYNGSVATGGELDLSDNPESGNAKNTTDRFGVYYLIKI